MGHSFLNPLVGNDVLRRRAEAGKPPCKLCVFVHGTALKMYVHERNASRIFTISKQQVDAFLDVFPDFPCEKVTVSPNGIDFDTFRATDMTRDQVLAEIKTAPYEGEGEHPAAGYDKMITFVGKFANWKRLDSLPFAAVSYEKH